MDREEGALVPLDNYVNDMYDFMDGINESRCTNFETLGLWMNLDCLKDVPKVTSKLSFRIVPIVPRHKDGGKLMIPYNNYMKHLTHALSAVDKPFR
jgi:hypothetical protein